MRYWLDTKFIENGIPIDLISIGIIAEDGREFYAESLDCDLSKASPWVKENVIPHLASQQENKSTMNAWSRDGGVGGLMNRTEIRAEIIRFCNIEKYGNPEFWAYYADYDWVVFCQLFGTMMDLPEGFPMYCRDIKQECDRLGNPELPTQKNREHNSLEEARWNKKAWEFLDVIHRRNNGFFIRN
jgi:3' exoribonuclease, RNase T-like